MRECILKRASIIGIMNAGQTCPVAGWESMRREGEGLTHEGRRGGGLKKESPGNIQGERRGEGKNCDYCCVLLHSLLASGQGG